ncbi:hypothetical protein T10_13225 [Trichinella papuae]|uniref:Uncharacterized protein n=1 Tax=Trichinella papuae TaxID=268474 RepID=A0A0V1M4K2_9BILA|nr:hypothetical protein T10_13225 [Trichinella papuae]
MRQPFRTAGSLLQRSQLSIEEYPELERKAGMPQDSALLVNSPADYRQTASLCSSHAGLGMHQRDCVSSLKRSTRLSLSEREYRWSTRLLLLSPNRFSSVRISVEEPSDFYTSRCRRLLDRCCFFRVRAVALIMQRIPERPGVQAMQHIREPFQVLLFRRSEDDESMIQIDDASFPGQHLIVVSVTHWNAPWALPRLNGITLNRKSASFSRCEELALRQSASQLPISEDGQRSLPDFLRTSTTDDGFNHTSLKHFAQNMDYDSIMRHNGFTE